MITTEQMINITRGNVDAMMMSSKIWAEGMQGIAQTFASMAQRQIDSNMSAFTAVCGAKSIEEAVELQSGRVKKAVEKASADAGKMADDAKKLSANAIEPLKVQASLETEHAKH